MALSEGVHRTAVGKKRRGGGVVLAGGLRFLGGLWLFHCVKRLPRAIWIISSVLCLGHKMVAGGGIEPPTRGFSIRLIRFSKLLNAKE